MAVWRTWRWMKFESGKIMVDAAGLFDRLYHSLMDQVKIIDLLMAAAGARFEALKENDLGRLNKITGGQEALAAQLEKAESERLRIQESLENTLNVAKGSTLSGLLAHAPEPVKTALGNARAALRQKTRDLKEINARGSALIEKMMLVNNRLIKIVNAGIPKTYGFKGEVRDNLHYAPVLNESV